jgi:two-component system, cell cycle sensor histidine kinase and response regulator CckA
MVDQKRDDGIGDPPAGQTGQWLELILDITRTGVDVIDEEFNLRYVDPGWQRVYGDPRGRKCYEYFMGGDAPCAGCGIPRAIATGQVQVTEERLPREGNRIIEVHTIPFRSGDGRRMVAEFNVDVTTRARAEQERLELERRLLHAQKLESLGVMAGGIAHDFNNLLLAVLGQLDLALGELPADAPAHARLQLAEQAARRGADLTRQLLAYSGKGLFVVQPVDLSVLVEENASLLRAAAGPRASLTLRLGRPLPPIQADPGQMQQVVMNLLTNAAESIDPGPGAVTVATTVVDCSRADLERTRLDTRPEPGEFVLLAVSDTGCGMDAITLQRLFDPFFSTKSAGRGLGLSAVLGIVKSHGGALFVDSSPGRGSTVQALFPAGGARLAPPAAAGDAAAARGRPSPGGLVLVVDDEDMARAACLAMVERIGYRGLAARDGYEAVELVRRRGREITCVILDLTMPGMDGVATLAELRKLAPALEVLLTSGYSEQEATRGFFGQGPAGFIQKPYRVADLAAALADILGPIA